MSTVANSAPLSTSARLARVREGLGILARAWEELRDRQAAALHRACKRWRVSRAHVRSLVTELARHADAVHADCYPTQERLAERLDVSVSTVRRATRAAELVGFVETLSGPDAWAVYGHDPRAGDLRRSAYRLPVLAAAWQAPQRAPRHDRRTPWQRQCARFGWRQQRRAAQRELERLAGQRGVLLTVGPRPNVEPGPRTVGPRTPGVLPLAASIAKHPSTHPHTRERQQPVTKPVQPLGKQREPERDSASAKVPSWLQGFIDRHGGRSRPPNPPR